MKKDTDNFHWVTFCVGFILAMLIFGALFNEVESEKSPQNYNDVTFEVIETSDSAGNYIIYDTSTGIVYRGGSSAYKPYYSEDGYLYIYRDGRLQEVR